MKLSLPLIFTLLSAPLYAEVNLLVNDEKLTFSAPYPDEMRTVSRWTERATFSGLKLLDVPAVRSACSDPEKMIALDAENDFTIELLCEDIERYDPLIAFEMDGGPLPDEFGDAFLTWPRRYSGPLNLFESIGDDDDWRWIWKLAKIRTE